MHNIQSWNTCLKILLETWSKGSRNHLLQYSVFISVSMAKLRNSIHEPSRSYSCRAPRRRIWAKTQIFLWQTSRVLLGCRQTEEMVMNKDTGKTKHLFHWLHVCGGVAVQGYNRVLINIHSHSEPTSFWLLVNPLCPITEQTTDNRPKIFIDTGAHFFVDKLMHFILSFEVYKSMTISSVLM